MIAQFAAQYRWALWLFTKQKIMMKYEMQNGVQLRACRGMEAGRKEEDARFAS